MMSFSDLIHLILKLNCIPTILTKDLIRIDASDLSFMRYIHVNLDLSSTTVKKYLKKNDNVTNKEHNISIWIKSKQLS